MIDYTKVGFIRDSEAILLENLTPLNSISYLKSKTNSTQEGQGHKKWSSLGATEHSVPTAMNDKISILSSTSIEALDKAWNSPQVDPSVKKSSTHWTVTGSNLSVASELFRDWTSLFHPGPLNWAVACCWVIVWGREMAVEMVGSDIKTHPSHKIWDADWICMMEFFYMWRFGCLGTESLRAV
jgi:hypothetical protein